MAAQMLDESREKMNTADKERLDALLSPLKERLEAFNQTVTNNSKENTANKTEIKNDLRGGDETSSCGAGTDHQGDA